jgi:hypothetical protein
MPVVGRRLVVIVMNVVCVLSQKKKAFTWTQTEEIEILRRFYVQLTTQLNASQSLSDDVFGLLIFGAPNYRAPNYRAPNYPAINYPCEHLVLYIHKYIYTEYIYTCA